VDDDLGALEASLRRRFRVEEMELDLGSHFVSLLHPASAEDLINEAEFERDERLPYWAEVWPSARVLAAEILGRPAIHQSLLELGCGAGLVATGAALAGYRVCASDYYEDALRFARVNAWRNAGVAIGTAALDWRRLRADPGRYDVVVGSDVLYERPYGELVARVVSRTLAPGGLALIADPGRVARDDFLAALDGESLMLASRREVPFHDGPIKHTITILEIASS